MFDLFLALLALLSIIIIVRNPFAKPKNYPPGPRWIPFFGNFFLLKDLSKRLGGQHLALSHLAKKYKTNVLGLKLGRDYVVTVFSYDLVRQIQLDEDFSGRPDGFFMRLRSMGQRRGITGVDGEIWKIQRSFVVTHLRTLGFGKRPMESFITEEIHEILDILTNEGQKVEIRSIFAPAVISVLWAFVGGSRLSRHEKRLQEILQILDKRSAAFDMAGGTLNQLPFLRFLAPEKTGYNLILNLNMKMKKLFQEAIDWHSENWSEEKSNDDLLYSFISEMKKNGDSTSTFTEDQLIMVCVDIFIAGSYTTANTLDFACLMMILYPDVKRKVHECIASELQGKQEITYADRTRVPYIEAVIMEVERYCEVVPVTGPRRVLKNTVLDGYQIPKDTTILISTHSVHKDEGYWIDPEVFRPERFLDANGKLLSSDRLMPFGLGKRRCLGETLARSCIFVFFVEIMRKFNVTFSQGFEAPKKFYKSGITLTPEYYRADFVSRN